MPSPHAAGPARGSIRPPGRAPDTNRCFEGAPVVSQGLLWHDAIPVVVASLSYMQDTVLVQDRIRVGPGRMQVAGLVQRIQMENLATQRPVEWSVLLLWGRCGVIVSRRLPCRRCSTTTKLRRLMSQHE